MHLAYTPHTYHTATCATEAPATDTAARHQTRRDRDPRRHTTETEAFQTLSIMLRHANPEGNGELPKHVAQHSCMMC